MWLGRFASNRGDAERGLALLRRMRDVRTDDIHDVEDRTVSRQLHSGQLYFRPGRARGRQHANFGGLEPVAPGERDDLIALLNDEPHSVELVALQSAGSR